MDKFENHIKKQYERQLKPVNPKAAWANFESERLGKEVKRKWIFLIFLIVGLGAVGSVIVYFSFEGLQKDEILVTESISTEILNPTETYTSQANVINEKDRNLENKNKSTLEKYLTKSFNVKKNATNQVSINNYSNSLKKEENQIKVINLSTSEEDIMIDTKKSTDTNVYVLLPTTSNESNADSKINDVLKTEIVDVTSLQSLKPLRVESTKIEEAAVKEIAKPSLQSTLLKSNDRWIYYGFYTGANSLNHRFIRKSKGVNLGLVVQAKLTKHLSIHALAGYSFMTFQSRVNSKDLRIKSLNINTRRLEVNSIDKSLHQLNSGIELSYCPIKRKKLGIDLTAGVVAKVDIEESNDYQVFENNMDSEIQQRNSINYYYPAYYKVSTGINYSLHDVRIVLRPYYMHSVFKSEINHPYEWGINTEILF
jgi:hypothetical protein